MKIKTLIVDDEPIALEKLHKYVEKSPSLKLAGKCSNALDAIGIINDGDIDLVITDINMPDLSGMDFIKSLTNPPIVIFTTAYEEYAVESYQVSAADYLLKPYDLATFQKAINKVQAIIEAGKIKPVPVAAAGHIFVKIDYKYLNVRLSDIEYIKGYGEYLQIFIAGASTPLTTLSTFAAIRNRLGEPFLQVHRSYIVNMERIRHVERARIVMPGDVYIPISDSYKPDFQDYINAHSIGGNLKG